MKLGDLIRQLEKLRDGGLACADSPVLLEGFDDEDELIQRDIESVDTEHRCESDGEPQAVYINMRDEDDE